MEVWVAFFRLVGGSLSLAEELACEAVRSHTTLQVGRKEDSWVCVSVGVNVLKFVFFFGFLFGE